MASNQNNENIITRVENLIQNNQTMTIATAINHQAWATPVFYVNKGPCLYFFSSPNSRHIKEALESGQAACTIFAQDAIWQNLMGLQMSGKVETISGSVEASKVILAYGKKFSLVKKLFSSIKNITLNDFSNKLNAKLYCFIPESILFMDNSIHFGFREEIKKDTLFK
jgi:uncharacterized protein YhbP (UPF0306 family)